MQSSEAPGVTLLELDSTYRYSMGRGESRTRLARIEQWSLEPGHRTGLGGREWRQRGYVQWGGERDGHPGWRGGKSEGAPVNAKRGVSGGERGPPASRWKGVGANGVRGGEVASSPSPDQHRRSESECFCIAGHECAGPTGVLCLRWGRCSTPSQFQRSFWCPLQ